MHPPPGARRPPIAGPSRRRVAARLDIPQRLDEAGAASGWPLVRVDGPICESTDTFGEHRLPPLRRGDLVAIRDTGAYGATMRSAYNGRPRPPEVFVEVDGSLTLARRRGTFASLG